MDCGVLAKNIAISAQPLDSLAQYDHSESTVPLRSHFKRHAPVSSLSFLFNHLFSPPSPPRKKQHHRATSCAPKEMIKLLLG